MGRKEIDPHRAIKDYVRNGGSPDWEYKEIAGKLYQLDDVFRRFIFAPLNEKQHSIPPSIIAVAPLRVEALAAYRLKENSLGLKWEIDHNAHYIDRPLYAIAESHLHEMIHLYQENTEGMKKCVNGFHNKEFVDLAESVGLHPFPGFGFHWKPADGQFARLMEMMGIEKPKEAEGDFVKPEGKGPEWWSGGSTKKPGKSTLVLYTNDSCTRKPTPCKIRSGKADLHITCTDCGGEFKPQA